MQTSSRALPASDLAALREQLCLVLADLRHPDDIDKFLSSFLTSTEYLVLIKRLAILKLLDQGHSYEAIAQQLKVSSATISSVAEQKTSPGLQQALQVIELDSWAQAWLDRLGAPLRWFKR